MEYIFFQHGYFHSYGFKYRVAHFHLEGTSQNPTAVDKRIFPRNISPGGGGGVGRKTTNQNPKGKFWKHLVPIRQSALLQRHPALAAFHATAAAVLCGGRGLLLALRLRGEGTIKEAILAPAQNTLTSGADRQLHNKCTLSKGEISFQRKLLFHVSHV